MEREVAVIGGGPGGACIATLLARGGKKVVLIEKEKCPRFHIGESLLPATMPILAELGVYEEMRRTFLNKPGGCWYYGDVAVCSDFSQCSDSASFAAYRHALMVERGEFDRILLDNARRSGVQVLEKHEVRDLVWEGSRLSDLLVRDRDNDREFRLRTHMVFDCSGYHALIARRLKLRRPNRLNRVAVFAHYEAEALDDRLRLGWFVGEMLYDGWIWLIPLSRDRISVGIVTARENYRHMATAPQEFLDKTMRASPLVRRALAPNARRVTETHLYGNLGYTSEQIHGNGWAMVGDAAVFIDPCYSTGVHLAMETGRMMARAYLKDGARPEVLARSLDDVEKGLRQHERLLTMMVDSFYIASRSSFVRKVIVKLSGIPFINRKFVHITGGDFAEPFYVRSMYWTNRLLALLGGSDREPATAASAAAVAMGGQPAPV